MILFSIFIFRLNVLTPYLPGDDHIFQLKIPDEGIIGTDRISTFSDLVESQTNFYKNYHYRVLNHTALQTLLQLPSWVFDFLNSLVFLLLPFCVLSINKRQKDYWLKYLIILFSIWLFHFDLGRCYFLTTGALNYSWWLIPQLLYVALLLKSLEEEVSYKRLIALALLNINANENVLVCLFLLTLYVLYKKWRGSMELLPFISALIILGLGGLFMILSPSISQRLASEGFREAGLLSHMLEYSKRTIFYLLNYLPVLLVGCMIAGKSFVKGFEERDGLLLFTIGCSLLVMIAIPLFEPRSAVFGFFVLLQLVMCRVRELPIPRLLLIVFIAAGFIMATQRYGDFVDAQSRHETNLALLTQTKNDTVELQPYCTNRSKRYLPCYPLSTDPDFIDNRSLAAVHDQQAVRLSKEYEAAHLSERIFDEIKQTGKLPNNFSKVNSTSPQSFWIAKEGSRVDLIIHNERSASNSFYICRGGQNKGLKNFFLNLLPEPIRINFLDKLEDVTLGTQERVETSGGSYAYLPVHQGKTYDYFLVASYSLVEHRVVGQIRRIENR